MTLSELAIPNLYMLTEGIAWQLGNSWYAGERDGRPVVTGKVGWLAFEYTQSCKLRITLAIEQLKSIEPIEIPPNQLGPGECSRIIQEHLLRPAYTALHQQARSSQAGDWAAQWQRWFIEQAAEVKLSVRFTTGYNQGQIVSLRVVFNDEKNTMRWATLAVFFDGHVAHLEVSDHAHELQELLETWISRATPIPPAASKRRWRVHVTGTRKHRK